MECYKKLISTEKESLLRTHRKTCILRKVLAAFAAVILATVFTIPAFASGGLELSTRYTGIYAKPGDTLNFDLDFSNYSDSVLPFLPYVSILTAPATPTAAWYPTMSLFRTMPRKGIILLP